MITSILLIWIGAQLNAPTWYYVLVSIGIFFRRKGRRTSEWKTAIRKYFSTSIVRRVRI